MQNGRRYKLLSVLGKGGFGTVYRARLLGEGGFTKPVALKVLNPEVAAAGDVARRLRDEARVLGLVQHRAIVGVDALVELDGRWTVVMQYVEGRDLKTLIEKGALPPGTAVEITGEIAGALHAAYSAIGPDGQRLRLLHRDIKPANICVTALGEVKVLDFGIARADFGEREARTRTMAYGTPDYMAPERFVFEDGPAGDVYSLGAVLYELLTAEPVGRASPNQLRHVEIVQARAARLTELLPPGSEEVVALVTSLLCYEAENRPTAREVERRCALLRHRLGDPLLRDWAETALPALVREQEDRNDPITGTILIESSAREGVEGAEWPESGALPRGPLPVSGETLDLDVTWGSDALAAPGPVDPELPRQETELREAPVVAPSAPTPPEEPPSTRPPQGQQTGVLAGLLSFSLIAVAAVGLWVWQTPAPQPPAPRAAPPAPVDAPKTDDPTADAPQPEAPQPEAPQPEAPPEPSAPPPAPAVGGRSAAKASPSPSQTSVPPEDSTRPQAAPSASAADASLAAGRWAGSINGRPVDLALSGGDSDLRGEVVVHAGGLSQPTDVGGHYDPDTRTLVLEDRVAADDAGRYTATLSSDGDRLTGNFKRKSNGDFYTFVATRAR